MEGIGYCSEYSGLLGISKKSGVTTNLKGAGSGEGLKCEVKQCQARVDELLGSI